MHLHTKDLEKENHLIHTDNDLILEKIAQNEDKIVEQKNILTRLRYLFDQDEGEILQESQVLIDVAFKNAAIDNSLQKQFILANLVKEQVRVIQDQLRAHADGFQNQENLIRELGLQLDKEIAKMQKLATRSYHFAELKKELFRLSKELISTQVKAKVLEVDLDRPTHIHRWRFLQVTDPERYQTLFMTQYLKDQLLISLDSLNNLRERKKRLFKKTFRFQKMVTRVNFAEEVDKLTTLLNEGTTKFVLMKVEFQINNHLFWTRRTRFLRSGG